MKVKKKILIAILCIGVILGTIFIIMQRNVITYSLYPYLMDNDYYRSVVEEEWQKVNPNIKLKYVEYDCYYDGKPKGIDVIMYDSILESYFASEGFIQAIDKDEIENADDFFDYAMDGTTYNGKLYGIPAILCSNYFIYDKDIIDMSNVASLYDLSAYKDNILIPLDYDSKSYSIDEKADILEEYSEKEPYYPDERCLDSIKEYAAKNYLGNSSFELAKIYDDNNGVGYFGYSETIASLDKRKDNTGIATISLSKGKNIQLYYVDIVGISSNVKGKKRDACLQLMNLIASKELMQKVAVKDNAPSYLIFPREGFYSKDILSYSLYNDLFEFVSKPENKVFRYPENYHIN